MSVSIKEMPHGDRAFVIHRKINKDGIALVFFDLDSTPWCICGFCGCGWEARVEENLVDLAKWYVEHCRYSPVQPHPTSERLSEVALAKTMSGAFPCEGTRHTFKRRRKRLLHEGFITQLLGEEVVAKMTRTEKVPVCRMCLSRETSCCAGRVPISVTMLRAGKKMEPILCTEDLEKLGFEHNLLCQKHSGLNAETVAALNNVVQDLKRSHPGEGSHPSPPSSTSKRHRLLVGAVVDGRAGDAIKEWPIDKSTGIKFFHRMCLKAKD